MLCPIPAKNYNILYLVKAVIPEGSDLFKS